MKRSSLPTPGVRTAQRVLVVTAMALPFAAVVPSLAPSATAPSAANAPQAGSPAETATLLDAYDEALGSVMQELAHLVLLDWVERPLPPAAADMPLTVGLAAGDLPTLVQQLRFIDGTRGPAALDELLRLGEMVPEDLFLVLSRNLPEPSEVRPRIGTGPYLRAYDQILGRWAALSGTDPRTDPSGDRMPSGGGRDEGGAGSTERPASSDGAPTRTGAATPDDTGDSRPWWLVTLAALAAAVAVGAIGWFVARRRSTTATPSYTEDEVLDAGRTVLGAADPVSFGRVVAEQVQRLTRSSGGALVADDGSWTAGSITLPPIELIARVLSTGASLHTHEVTISPVVVEGRVIAALVAATADPAAEEVLETFGPLVGAALRSNRTRAEHEQLAFDDGLTKVGNRRRFDRDLCHFVNGSTDRPTHVALAMVDVDHFKEFNDRYGHQAGDEMLRHVAAVLRANVRDGDYVYRYGGEEFAVLLPGASLEEATTVVERVREAVETTPAPAGLPSVTVSVGVSASPQRDGTEMLRAADSALYAAKSGGRNRVVTSPSAGVGAAVTTLPPPRP